MADVPTKGMVPGQGYEKLAADRSDGSLRAGRGVPDERRDFSERREEDVAPSADPASASFSARSGDEAAEYEGGEGQTARGTHDTPQELQGGTTPSPPQ